MGGASGGAYGAGTSTATSTGTGSSINTSTGTAGGATGGTVETSTGTAGGTTGGTSGGAGVGAEGSAGGTGAAGAGTSGAAVSGGKTGGAGGESGTTKDRKWRLGIEGGYSTLNMKEVNDNYDAVVGPLGSVTKIENGYDVAGELMYDWGKRFSVGPRVEYLMANQGKVSTLLGTAKEDLSLMPVLIGGRYALKEMGQQTDVKNVSFKDRWDLNIGAFAGWAWAWGKTSFAGTDFNYSGNSFAGDALLGWNYRLSRDWTLGVDLGYRYAPIDEMKYTENKDGVRKDQTVTDRNDKKLKYDFSGLIANIGVGFKF
jgi:hypothetical protein